MKRFIVTYRNLDRKTTDRVTVDATTEEEAVAKFEDQCVEDGTSVDEIQARAEY